MQARRLLGYSIDDPAAAVRAYRMRYRGDAATALDDEDLRILHALTHAVPGPAPAPLPADARPARSDR